MQKAFVPPEPDELIMHPQLAKINGVRVFKGNFLGHNN